MFILNADRCNAIQIKAQITIGASEQEDELINLFSEKLNKKQMSQNRENIMNLIVTRPLSQNMLQLCLVDC